MMNAIQNLFSIFAITFLAGACSSFGQETGGKPEATLVKAKTEYHAANHSSAYPLLKEVWKNEDLPKSERLEAGALLAKMEWRLYDNPVKAHKTAARLEKLEQEIAKIYTLRSRIFAYEQDYEEAIQWSQKALDASVSELEQLRSATVYGTNILMQARQDLLDNGRLSLKSVADLETGFARLEGWVDERQDNFDLARLHLGHALLLGKGKEALLSWKRFYRLDKAADAHPSLIRSPQVLADALTGFDETQDKKDVIRAIIKGLAESGFIEYARLLKIKELGQAPDTDEKINEYVHYHDYLIRLEKTVLNYNRKLVEGKAKGSDLKEQFEKDSRWLWSRLDWKGGIPDYSQAQFIKTMKDRFRLLIEFIYLNNRYGMHAGQIILNDTRTISQHGQSASFRYMLIEHTYSNGFTSWFTDGANSTGGWATGQGTFTQVRTGLNSMITELWTMLTDPFESKKVNERVERMSRNEDDMARKNKYGYLPGLQYRLILRETREVLDSLKGLGLDEKQLRYSFISYMERIGQDAKIYAHEGRHSIDMKYGFTSGSANLEFTAKLSEIYFAEKPFFFLGTLLTSTIGNGTAHGEANLRLCKSIVDWMDENRDAIEEFDDTKPVLPQVEKMTDAQLRAAISSVDPLVKAARRSTN